ncbi:hypothetical protein ACLK15_25555 [Escherichia coli]
MFEIYPPKPLHSIALGSRIRRCVKTINLGVYAVVISSPRLASY